MPYSSHAMSENMVATWHSSGASSSVEWPNPSSSRSYPPASLLMKMIKGTVASIGSASRGSCAITEPVMAHSAATASAPASPSR